MMKEPWWELVAPLITVLFPPASNVRKNTQWQVCKRASTKLLSGKINGGSCGPHSDLRGQLVTAPWRCWGQQCSGSVSWRGGERHPHASEKNVGECPLCSCLSDLLHGRELVSNFCCYEGSWNVNDQANNSAPNLFKSMSHCTCHTYAHRNRMKEEHQWTIWSKFRSALVVLCCCRLIKMQVYDKLSNACHYTKPFVLKSNMSAHLKC